MPPRLVLVGPPGSGKSTVAALVAERLGISSRDTDADIEAAAGASVADIFVDHGEEEFRRREVAAVAAALRDHEGVLAVGGGAVLDPGTRMAMRGLTVVFLAVGIKDAASRIGLNRDRPLLLGNPRAQWIDLMSARLPLYDEVATIHVGTDGKTAAEVADEVTARLTDTS